MRVEAGMALLLSKDGMVYSWGEDKSRRGLLGTVSNGSLAKPCPISALIDFNIK